MIKPEKINLGIGTFLYPLPAVLVSCGKTPDEYNLISISWTGTINSDPPMLYISIRKNRYSYDIIKRNMEFVINLTNEHMAKVVDFCGIKSGRNYNKFKEANLTAGRSQKIDSVLIEEAPVNIECKVTKIVALGSHDMFMAKVVNVQAVEYYINKETGKIDFTNSNLLAYANKKYFTIGESLGDVGFSRKK